MPTNRLNISIVDEEVINDLEELRRIAERVKNKRYSRADIIKALLLSRESDDMILNYL